MICPCKCLAIHDFFSFAPLVAGRLAQWAANVAARFFSIQFKAKRSFERNPVINISKWFIYSIFALAVHAIYFTNAVKCFSHAIHLSNSSCRTRKSMELSLGQMKTANRLCEFTQSTLYRENCEKTYKYGTYLVLDVLYVFIKVLHIPWNWMLQIGRI